jgi:hypothetical protein
MLKNLGLTAALILSMVGIVRGQTVSPNAPKSEQPLCYFQTANGRVINLENLCAQTTQTNTNSQQSDANNWNQHRRHHYHQD